SRRGEQRLRRDTPGDEAVAAEQPPLHERDAPPEARGPERRDQAGGAAPDDDQVVAPLGDGGPPAGRTDVVEERAVVRVHREGTGHRSSSPVARWTTRGSPASVRTGRSPAGGTATTVVSRRTAQVP